MRWFKPVGPFFVPVSISGAVIAVATSAFCAQVFWAIDRYSHSVSDTLYGIYHFWVPTLLALAWIAPAEGAAERA